jgi:hypothetical protein
VFVGDGSGSEYASVLLRVFLSLSEGLGCSELVADCGLDGVIPSPDTDKSSGGRLVDGEGDRGKYLSHPGEPLRASR